MSVFCSAEFDVKRHDLCNVCMHGCMDVWMYVCMYGHHLRQRMEQPCKVSDLACGQLTGIMDITLSPCAPENLVSRYRFDRPVPRHPAHMHSPRSR